MSTFQSIAEELRAYALSLPEAYEDFPWGERVAKVNKKIFVFFGMDEALDRELNLGMKLPYSAEGALAFPFSKPTGYGLGRAGWVSLRFEAADDVPLDLLEDWIGESYRAIAPKRLSAQLHTASDIIHS